nr:long-chain acyl-CoA synthetase 8 [Ipomoea batatas]GMD82525.1 long-chain acyl-CoA synthetase 8 [Ipomoea batatas]GME07517.1 long-chain acyl-CoA synthetase 8 [Ipomoea batatas]
MVSELAGEGAMSLPAPASHVELRRVHLQRSFNVAAKILKRRAGPGAAVGSGGGFKASKQESSCNLSRVLINHRFKASNCTSWSRSMKNSSKRFVNLFFTVFNRRSVKVSSRVLVDVVFAVFDHISRSRFVKLLSKVLIIRHFFAIFKRSRSVKFSSRVLVDVVVFAVFSRSSRSISAESSSVELVLAISSRQRRTRNKKQSITSIPKLPINTGMAIIMYTSGSTGLPKSVMIIHGNIVATSAAVMIVIPNLGTNDVYVAYLPLAHVFEFDTEILVMAGGASIGYSSALSLIDTSNKVKSIVETNNKQSIVELDFELRLVSFYLFFCLKFELVFDGHLYLSEDDKRGAVAVVASMEIDIEEILGCKALVIVEDTNVVLAVLNDVMEDRYNVLITLVNQFAANQQKVWRWPTVNYKIPLR